MVAFEPELHARLPDKYKPDQVGQLLNGKFAFKAEPPLSDEWTAQQMREATPWCQRPKYLIRDNDIKYGRKFKYGPESSGIKDINTSVRAPRANTICERFIGTLKLDCLDHYLILHERQLRRVVGEFVAYYNDSRPHQGIDQVVPNRFHEPRPPLSNRPKGSIVSKPVLRGLHRSYSYSTTIH